MNQHLHMSTVYWLPGTDHIQGKRKRENIIIGQHIKNSDYIYWQSVQAKDCGAGGVNIAT